MIKNIDESDVSGFVKMVLAKFDWFPKIAELERAVKGSPEIQAEKSWSSLVNKSSTDNIIIHDPYAYQVVAGYGSWYAFCQHRDDSPEWCRKEFIRRYMMFMENGNGEDVDIKLLAGAYRCHYGSEFRGVQTITIGKPKKQIAERETNPALEMAENLKNNFTMGA